MTADSRSPASDFPSSPSATVAAALQFVALAGIFLLHPVQIAERVGVPQTTALSMVSLTLVALAIGTLLQAFVLGPVGSGMFCPPTPSVVFLVPSLNAARTGSLSLVFGVTVVAGLFQIAFAPLVRRMRPVFPPEIPGIIAVLLGVSIAIIGLRTLLELPGGPPAVVRGLTVSMGALALMVALAVWVPRLGRIFSLGIGMLAGWALALLLEVPLLPQAARFQDVPLFALPSFGHIGFEFSAQWIPSALFAAVAASLKTIGNLTALEQSTVRDWRRPDLTKVRGGLVADGLMAAMAGGIGAHGVNSAAASTGLALAGGFRGRRLAIVTALLFLALACSPKVASFFWLVPRPVGVAALMFCGVFLAVSGLRLMTHRMIDARRGIVIGLGLMAGLAIELHPGLVRSLPQGMQSLVGSSLVFGSLMAIVLTVFFRIRAKQRSVLVIEPGAVDSRPVEDFMTLRGEAWGARHEVVVRAAAAIAQAAETINAHEVARGPLEVNATFDEFNLNVEITYHGPALEFPAARPTLDEIADDPAGEQRLAGYLVRRLADRVDASALPDRARLILHFDH